MRYIEVGEGLGGVLAESHYCAIQWSLVRVCAKGLSYVTDHVAAESRECQASVTSSHDAMAQ